jgi:hypothetical protein
MWFSSANYLDYFGYKILGCQKSEDLSLSLSLYLITDDWHMWALSSSVCVAHCLLDFRNDEV